MKTIAIAGASRGLGLGLAKEFLRRGWRVIATQRRADDGLAALVRKHEDRARIETLDVTSAEARTAFGARLRAEGLDVMFVCAGIAGDHHKPAGSLAADRFAEIMLTNAHAPLALIEEVAPAIPGSGAVVAMTSLMGSVAGDAGGGMDSYRASKAALNMLLRSFSARHRDLSIIAMHPGWVRTDMGGPEAPLSVEESARGMADVVEANLGMPGCRFLDHSGKSLAW